MSITRPETSLDTTGGLALLRDAAARQLAMRGKHFDIREYGRVVACPQRGRSIAKAYQRAPVITSAAVRSYDALRAEVDKQYQLLTDPPSRGGLGFTVTFVAEDPYYDVDPMLTHLDNGWLQVWLTAACGNRHPLLSDSENDLFRAVHDAFGHGGTGRGFDVHGEEAAWLLHHRMFSVRAQPALTTETRGQTNAMVFGSPPGVFRRQKAVLLPAIFDDESTVHVGPCGGSCVKRGE